MCYEYWNVHATSIEIGLYFEVDLLEVENKGLRLLVRCGDAKEVRGELQVHKVKLGWVIHRVIQRVFGQPFVRFPNSYLRHRTLSTIVIRDPKATVERTTRPAVFLHQPAALAIRLPDPILAAFSLIAFI